MDEKELKKQLTELKSTPDRLLLVRALIDCGFNKTDALKKIGKSKSWLYSIPEDELERLIDLAKEYNLAFELQAYDKLKAAVNHAVDVQVKLIDARDDRVKQAAINQVLDRGLGKVTDKIDVTTQGEKVNSIDGYDRAISTLANAIRKSVPGEGAEQDGALDSTE